MILQFLPIIEMPAAIGANQEFPNLSIHTLPQLFMYHLQNLVLHQVWQVIPVGVTKGKRCHIHIHGPGRMPLGAFLQLGSLAGAGATLSTLSTLSNPLYTRAPGVGVACALTSEVTPVLGRARGWAPGAGCGCRLCFGGREVTPVLGSRGGYSK